LSFSTIKILKRGCLCLSNKPRIMINEILPVYDLQVELNIKEEIKSIFLEPEGQEINFQQKENGKVIVNVPKIDVHSMLVINTK